MLIMCRETVSARLMLVACRLSLSRLQALIRDKLLLLFVVMSGRERGRASSASPPELNLPVACHNKTSRLPISNSTYMLPCSHSETECHAKLF